MKRKTDLRTVSLVRRIRDTQARRLAKKSTAEVIDFFNQAAERAQKRASKLQLTAESKPSNRSIQPTRRQKQRRAADA